MAWSFLLGLAFAFVAGLPVTGPAAVLVAEAAVRGRTSRAVAVGVGAAIPEGLWAGLALGGVGSIVPAGSALGAGWQVAGGLVLVGVGVALWTRRPTGRARPAPARPAPASLVRAMVVGFATTALNPTLLVTWGTVSTALVTTGTIPAVPGGPALFGLGVTAGASLAALTLATVASGIRRRFGGETPGWIGRAAASVVVAIGLASVLRALV